MKTSYDSSIHIDRDEEIDEPCHQQSYFGVSRVNCTILVSMLTADYLLKASPLVLIKAHKIVGRYNSRRFHSLFKRGFIELLGFRHYILSEKGREIAHKIAIKSAVKDSPIMSALSKDDSSVYNSPIL